MGATLPLACDQLTDTKPVPTAKFVAPAAASENYKTALHVLTDKSRLMS